MKYDYLVVGAGLFGSIIAREATNRGFKCLVIDKRDHIGGNCYSETVDGIDVHRYGPHIFHTANKEIWDYIQQFSIFENFELNVIANNNNVLYNLPFNMWTFYQMWGVKTEKEVKEIIEKQKFKGEPKNLEEYALSLVGEDIYKTLIYGHTKKQWMTEPSNLPASIIKRLPLRFTFDNNYFNDAYQGIPRDGYTKIFQNMLDGIHVELGIDYFLNRDKYNRLAKTVVYTGPIDKFYDYCYGVLDYRATRFIEERYQVSSFQSCPLMTFTSEADKFTRITEHKFFKKNHNQTTTIITKEFPEIYTKDSEPLYPINDSKNTEIFQKYKSLTQGSKVIFGGRLAEYRYYDMHQVIGSALATASKKIPF